MTGGLTRILTRAGAALAALTLAAGGFLAISSAPAQAGSTSYTMTCKDWWNGSTGSSGGATIRHRASNSTCSYHYAWANVYYATSSGSNSTGKRQSATQATTSSAAGIVLDRSGTYRTWHSGCQSSCHSKNTTP